MSGDQDAINALLAEIPKCAAAACNKPAFQGNDQLNASAYCGDHLIRLALAQTRRDTEC